VLYLEKIGNKNGVSTASLYSIKNIFPLTQSLLLYEDIADYDVLDSFSEDTVLWKSKL